MNYLCFLIDATSLVTVSVQLTNEPIKKQLNSIAAKDIEQGEACIFPNPALLDASVSLLSTLIALALFICTQAAEVDGGSGRGAAPGTSAFGGQRRRR